MMFLRNSLIVALALVGSNVSAGLVARDTFNEFVARQTPNPCTSTCAPWQEFLDVCTTLSCLCTATSAKDLQICVDCFVHTSPTPEIIADAVNLVDTFQESCKGFALPTVTVAASSGITVSLTSTATFPLASTITVITTTTPQIVIGPSSTSSLGPGNTGNSGYAVSRGIVVAISAALGMALVY